MPKDINDIIPFPGFSEQDFANAVEYLEKRQFLKDNGPLAQFINRIVKEEEQMPKLKQH